MLAAGCVTHAGAWRSAAEPAATTAGTVDLVVVANTAPAGRSSHIVAKRVAQTLGTEGPKVLVWLGDVAAAPMRSASPLAQRRGPRCLDPATALDNPALAPLVTAARPRFDNGQALAAIGPSDHRCGHAQALQSGTLPPTPSASHFAARVLASGKLELWARCDDGSCQFERTAATDDDAIADLIVIDPSPWLYPGDTPQEKQRDELSLLALDTLLLALASDPAPSPPRLLISSIPVEAAGEHGLGALWPDATFHTMPPALQDALVEGRFAGVIGAYDRSSSAVVDLFNPIKRSDRMWLSHPMFQVQVGALAAANRRPAMARRRRRVRQSQAFRPPTFSDHPGFAVIHLGAEQAELTLHAYRRGHWESTTIAAPLRPKAHPPRTPTPVMTPCRDCPAIPVNER